jgi:Secretion system C-terminal sorting domain
LVNKEISQDETSLNLTLDTSGLQSGIYFIKTVNSGETKVDKLMITN